MLIFNGCMFCLVIQFSAEGAMKARREIADYIKNKRTERARIRVSQLVMAYSSGVGDLMAELQSAD